MKAHSVLASIKDFEKTFPKAPKEGERRIAIEKYFSIHGVVKAVEVTGKEWPKLVYPNYGVLESKIREIRGKKKIYENKLGSWKKQNFDASMYHQVNQVKKFAEPLYWRHLAKSVVDSDYRKDADSVKLPAHLVADKKWKPMVKMFVNDIEYRKNLTETVNTSIVYKKNKKVAQFADDLQGFRKDATQRQVDDLAKKLLELEETEKALKEMQKWARE